MATTTKAMPLSLSSEEYAALQEFLDRREEDEEMVEIFKNLEKEISDERKKQRRERVPSVPLDYTARIER